MDLEPEDSGVALPGRPREELVARRLERVGWLWVLAGVLVPIVALIGCRYGYVLARTGRPRRGWPLVAVALIVFGVRLALFASTGHHSAI